VAEIVLGLAPSHTPQMSTSAEFWKEHAGRDERNAQLLGRDGRYRSYDDLLANADPGLAGELEAPVWKDKFDRAQAPVGALARLFEGNAAALFGLTGLRATHSQEAV
jgi:3-O-methylgallate 3,4-dioxygenase